MGYDLDHTIIFDYEIIEQSVHSHPNAPTTSKSRTRRLLTIITQHLNPDFDGPHIYHEYKRNDPNPPYTTKEIHNIWQWANTTDKRTHTKQLIVACGLGAGLTAKETGQLTGADIKIDTLGVMLHLPDRTVPVLNEWDRVLRDHKQHYPDNQYILCPRSTRRKPNHLRTTQRHRNHQWHHTTKHATRANHMDRRTPQQPRTRRSNLRRCGNQNTQKLRTLPTRNNLGRKIPQPPPQSARNKPQRTSRNPLNK